MAKRFGQRLPKAQVELVDDAGHLVFIDQTDVVLTQLHRFLAAPSAGQTNADVTFDFEHESDGR